MTNSINKTKYDVVFSLGEACFCATFLDNLKLRHFSAPLDWVAGATFAQRVELLCNDFENYFNKEDLSLTGHRDNPEPCDIYYNNRTGITFNHDFSLNGNFAEDFPRVKAKYNHRIDGLFSRIKKAKKVLIVFMELRNSSNASLSDDDIIALADKIRAKFSDIDINLMYIRHNENMKDGEFSVKELSPYVKFAQCFNWSRIDPVNGVGNLENVRPILADVECKGDFIKTLKHKFYKYMKKFLRLFYRRKYRNGKEIIRILGITVKTRYC